MTIKKIQSKQEHERKQRRNNVIAASIMLIVILLGIMGYAFTGSMQNETNTENGIQEYNGYEFLVQNGYWILKQNQDIAFVYGPSEVPEITIESLDNSSVNGIGDYYDSPVYIADISPENLTQQNSAAKGEIYRILDNYAERVQGACVTEDLGMEECRENLPLKDCSNNIVVLNATTKNKDISIKQKENCLIISSNVENITQTSDAYLYKLLEIK